MKFTILMTSLASATTLSNKNTFQHVPDFSKTNMAMGHRKLLQDMPKIIIPVLQNKVKIAPIPRVDINLP